jgi:HSP20 family molecular chaperone IbpA
MFALMPWRTGTREIVPRAERTLEPFERLWDRLMGLPMAEMLEAVPRWDLTMEDRPNEMLVRAELPGFTPEEVHVEVLGGRMTIEAKHTEPAAEKEERRPREHVHVLREIVLPPGIDANRVEAQYRNGVLEVHVPRTPEATPRRIEVRA